MSAPSTTTSARTPAPSLAGSFKPIAETIGVVSTTIGVVKSLRDMTTGFHAVDFAYEVGNAAGAILLAWFLCLCALFWISLLWQGLYNSITERGFRMIVVGCGLVGLYWAAHRHYAVERPWGVGLGALILLLAAWQIWIQVERRLGVDSSPPN